MMKSLGRLFLGMEFQTNELSFFSLFLAILFLLFCFLFAYNTLPKILNNLSLGMMYGSLKWLMN
jgi:hypothetical protein